ncbi:MAG: hypothetical protein KKE44_26640 [Proteobacteria bacterium]|nr:hypothetical protein [Pseudomonadota bacterium]MBU1586310.1 hypothetical protein [Pseudomonadota bacterium]MBU2630779.1 hypothetical protein [Pseudomonadota bacterium]
MGLSKELKLPGAKRKLQGILSSHLEQISQWLIEGYTKKQVFEFLKNENIIDCSYNHFNTTINKLTMLTKKAPVITLNQPRSSSVPPKKGFELVRLSEDDFK